MSKPAIYKLKYKFYKNKCKEQKTMLKTLVDMNFRYNQALESMKYFLQQVDFQSLNEKNDRVNNELSKTSSESPNAYDSEYSDSD